MTEFDPLRSFTTVRFGAAESAVLIHYRVARCVKRLRGGRVHERFLALLRRFIRVVGNRQHLMQSL
jgi:hypothetical protein